MNAAFSSDAPGFVRPQCRIDVNFYLREDLRSEGFENAWLELEVQVQPNYGPAFAEIVIFVHETRHKRTVQLAHRKGKVRIPLGDLKPGVPLPTRVDLSSRSRTSVRFRRIQLAFGDE